MKGLLVLAGAAIAVGLGVMAIAGLVLPDAVTPAAPETAPEYPAGTADVDTPSSVASLSWPPDNIGGLIEVTGDRPGTIEFDERQNAFATDSRFELASSESSMLLGDEDGTLFVDQMTYDGLNFFLDPGDCEFAEQDRTEEFGLVRLDVTCTGISDVQGNNTVTMEGAVDVPITIGVAGDEYASGGTLSLTGDVEADLEFPGAFWYDYPEESCIDCQLFNPPGEMRVDSPDPEDFSLEIGGLEDDGLFIHRLAYQDLEFPVSTDDCSVKETSVINVAPDTELVEFAIDCPELVSRDGDTTLSVSGSLRVHHIMVGATIFHP